MNYFSGQNFGASGGKIFSQARILPQIPVECNSGVPEVVLNASIGKIKVKDGHASLIFYQHFLIVQSSIQSNK